MSASPEPVRPSLSRAHVDAPTLSSRSSVDPDAHSRYQSHPQPIPLPPLARTTSAASAVPTAAPAATVPPPTITGWTSTLPDQDASFAGLAPLPIRPDPGLNQSPPSVLQPPPSHQVQVHRNNSGGPDPPAHDEDLPLSNPASPRTMANQRPETIDEEEAELDVNTSIASPTRDRPVLQASAEDELSELAAPTSRATPGSKSRRRASTAVAVVAGNASGSTSAGPSGTHNPSNASQTDTSLKEPRRKGMTQRRTLHLIEQYKALRAGEFARYPSSLPSEFWDRLAEVLNRPEMMGGDRERELSGAMVKHRWDYLVRLTRAFSWALDRERWPGTTLRYNRAGGGRLVGSNEDWRRLREGSANRERADMVHQAAFAFYEEMCAVGGGQYTLRTAEHNDASSASQPSAPGVSTFRRPSEEGDSADRSGTAPLRKRRRLSGRPEALHADAFSDDDAPLARERQRSSGTFLNLPAEAHHAGTPPPPHGHTSNHVLPAHPPPRAYAASPPPMLHPGKSTAGALPSSYAGRHSSYSYYTPTSDLHADQLPLGPTDRNQSISYAPPFAPQLPHYAQQRVSTHSAADSIHSSQRGSLTVPPNELPPPPHTGAHPGSFSSGGGVPPPPPPPETSRDELVLSLLHLASERSSQRERFLSLLEQAGVSPSTFDSATLGESVTSKTEARAASVRTALRQMPPGLASAPVVDYWLSRLFDRGSRDLMRAISLIWDSDDALHSLSIISTKLTHELGTVPHPSIHPAPPLPPSFAPHASTVPSNSTTLPAPAPPAPARAYSDVEPPHLPPPSAAARHASASSASSSGTHPTTFAGAASVHPSTLRTASSFGSANFSHLAPPHPSMHVHGPLRPTGPPGSQGPQASHGSGPAAPTHYTYPSYTPAPHANHAVAEIYDARASP